METILKFYQNPAHSTGSQNQVISRTMLKIAVVSRFFIEKHPPDMVPQEGELWRCRIANESKAGQNKGCFIVEPIHIVAEEDMVKLIPGTYTMKTVGNKLVVRPHKQLIDRNWMMPLQHKRMLAEEHNVYCVLVDLDATPVTTESAKTFD